MRTYGRITNDDGTKTWVVVTTDANGFDDDVYLTTLCQVFLLFLGESPFYANYGLPAKQTIVQQAQPDFYVSVIQQQFAPFFASLVVAKEASDPPTYRINVIKNNGAKVSATVETQVPQ